MSIAPPASDSVTNRRELEFSNQILKTKQDGTDRRAERPLSVLRYIAPINYPPACPAWGEGRIGPADVRKDGAVNGFRHCRARSSMSIAPPASDSVTNRRELEFSNQILKTKQDGTDQRAERPLSVLRYICTPLKPDRRIRRRAPPSRAKSQDLTGRLRRSACSATDGSYPMAPAPTCRSSL